MTFSVHLAGMEFEVTDTMSVEHKGGPSEGAAAVSESISEMIDDEMENWVPGFGDRMHWLAGTLKGMGLEVRDVSPAQEGERDDVF